LELEIIVGELQLPGVEVADSDLTAAEGAAAADSEDVSGGEFEVPEEEPE
jgi:hypothetical protein